MSKEEENQNKTEELLDQKNDYSIGIEENQEVKSVDSTNHEADELFSTIIKISRAVLIIIFFASIIVFALKIGKARNYSNAPSPFILAAKELGLKNTKEVFRTERTIEEILLQEKDQQEALLNAFYHLGYFAPEKLWFSLSKMSGIANRQELFSETIRILALSKALGNENFNPQILRKNLFKGTEFTTSSTIDWIIYTSQNALQNNSESSNILMTQIGKDEEEAFIINAAKLGLINRIYPSKEEYEQIWIIGGSRKILSARVVDAFKTLSNFRIKLSGAIVPIVSDREIYAEMDGICSDFQEILNNVINDSTNIDIVDPHEFYHIDDDAVQNGKDYILSLATRESVKLDTNIPFYFCTAQAQCINGKQPNLHFPNYLNPSSEKKLTESIMSIDTVKTLHTQISSKSNSQSESTLNNPVYTQHSIRSAALDLINKIKSGAIRGNKELNILIQTNNPRIKIEELKAEIIINELLQEEKLAGEIKINVEGVGFSNKSNYQEVAIALAELLELRYKFYDIKSNRDFDSLKYDTRDNSEVLLYGNIPNYSKEYLPKNFFERSVRYFDYK